MTNEHPSPPDWRGLCEELLGALENEGHAHWPGGPDGDPLIERARAVLARWGRPAPRQATEALFARPLMEQVAALGDRIGEQTVGQVRALADRAAAWLAANPPGQPVAIEPRGCPTPGACSCVELPATEPQP